MDFLYLPKLIFDNIDNVIISSITGAITSVLVSRMFFIKQYEDEKIRRFKPRLEVLYPMEGVMHVSIHYAEKLTKEAFSESLVWWAKQISNQLEEESRQFLYINFEDLDKDLHSVSVQHNDLIEEMRSCVLKPSKLSKEKLQEWCKVEQMLNVKRRAPMGEAKPRFNRIY
jgi:uncharacterized protein Usg